MERSRAYDALGACFETLNDDCDYAAWEQFLADYLAPYAFSEGIDIGCGNGYFTRAMEKRGYRMTGYDVSLPMLNRAKELSAKERLSSEYVLGDMATLCVRRKADFALAINDCVNYLPPEKCKTAFKRVASCLRKGGAFLFDVSSEYKLREKVANTILADDRDDMTYLCFTALKGNAVELDVTLFLREADGRFVRRDEKHIQYIHREEELLASLEAAGFAVVAVTGHLGESKVCSDRLVFLAERR